MNNSAFFISPAGEIIRISGSHISYVIENPDQFGLTSTVIHQIHRKYGEYLGFEGKARHEILISAIARGWIRIRRYRQCWSITVSSLSEDTMTRLKTWMDYISENPEAPVKILELDSDKEYYQQLREGV